MAQEVVDALRQCSAFTSLDDGAVGRIAAVGRVEHRPVGALVLEEGAVGPRMMIILRGRVQVDRAEADGQRLRLARLGPGEVLGELGFLLGLPRTATVRALEPLTVFALDRDAFEALVDADDPAALRLGLELARVVSRRLIALNDRVVRLIESSPPDLRAAYLRERQAVFGVWGD